MPSLSFPFNNIITHLLLSWSILLLQSHLFLVQVSSSHNKFLIPFLVHLILVEYCNFWSSLGARLIPPSFNIYTLLINCYYFCLYPVYLFLYPYFCWMFHRATLWENKCIICVSYILSLGVMLSFPLTTPILSASYAPSEIKGRLFHIMYSFIVVFVRLMLIVSFWYHLRPLLHTKFMIRFIFDHDSIIFTE